MPPKAPPRRLIKWIPRPVSDSSCLLVIIEGFLPDAVEKGLWRTRPVTKVLKPRELQTNSGSLYFLAGPIDVDRCEELGYPQAFIDAFYCGFPDRWVAILDELYKLWTGQIDIFGISLPFSLNNDFESPIPAKRRNKNLDKSYTSTPNAVVASRYGRTIKPRCANWAGQHIVYDKDGNVVEASQSRRENVDGRAFTKVCDTIGVALESRPAQLAIEPSPVSRRKPKETPTSSQPRPSQRKRKVHHGLSSDEEMSIDDEPLGQPTPIVMSRAAQQRRKRLNQLFESSDEDERAEEQQETKPKRKKTKTAPKKSKQAAAPVPRGRIRFPKPNLNDSSSTLFGRVNGKRSTNSPIVEYPASEATAEGTMTTSMTSTTVAPVAKKRWTEKEKTSLLKILEAKNPITLQDWESVTRSFGVSARPTSAYIEMAKKLNWKYVDSQGQRHSIAVSCPSAENVTAANLSVIDENEDPGNPDVSFSMANTAKPGTANYLVQADRLNRQMMANPIPNPQTRARLSSSRNAANMSADSSINFDDSIYEIGLPSNRFDAQKNTNRTNFLSEFLPTVSMVNKSFTLDDTAASNESDMEPGPSRKAKEDPKLRERILRRGYNALSKPQSRPNNHGSMSSMMVNRSTFANTTAAPALDSLFAKPTLTRKEIRNRRQEDLLDEELEEPRPEFSDDEEEDEGDLI